MSNQNSNPYAASTSDDVDEPDQPSDRLGCLLSIPGAVIGCVIAVLDTAKMVAKIRAEDPNAFIDYLPVLELLGIVVGGFAGLFVGKAISTFYYYRNKRSRSK